MLGFSQGSLVWNQFLVPSYLKLISSKNGMVRLCLGMNRSSLFVLDIQSVIIYFLLFEEENQKKYAEFDERFKSSTVLKELLEKSKLNKIR